MNLKDVQYDDVYVLDKFLGYIQQKLTLTNWNQIDLLEKFQVTNKFGDMLANKVKGPGRIKGRLGHQEHKHSQMLPLVQPPLYPPHRAPLLSTSLPLLL